jgi:hypothetical protein
MSHWSITWRRRVGLVLLKAPSMSWANRLGQWGCCPAVFFLLRSALIGERSFRSVSMAEWWHHAPICVGEMASQVTQLWLFCWLPISQRSWRGRGVGRLVSKILVLYRMLCQVWGSLHIVQVSMHQGRQSGGIAHQRGGVGPLGGHCGSG